MEKARLNNWIKALRCRLIDQDGTNHGEVATAFALGVAKKAGLDLVEVSPGQIPVCKIMDYGRVMYERSKAEKHQKQSPVMKEVRVSYGIGEADLRRQVEKARGFLKENHKVFFFMKLRGREKYVGGGEARQKFLAIVQELVPTLRMSDIQANERGISVALHPHNE